MYIQLYYMMPLLNILKNSPSHIPFLYNQTWFVKGKRNKKSYDDDLLFCQYMHIFFVSIHDKIWQLDIDIHFYRSLGMMGLNVVIHDNMGLRCDRFDVGYSWVSNLCDERAPYISSRAISCVRSWRTSSWIRIKLFAVRSNSKWWNS